MAKPKLIAEDEFDRWLSPAAVYIAMQDHLSTRIWRPLLLKRMEDGEVFAAARKAVYRVGNEPEQVAFREQLGWDHWKESAPKHDNSPFWESGDIVLTIRSNSRYVQDIKVSCVDVRFEPKGIMAMIPPVAALPRPPAHVVKLHPDPPAPTPAAPTFNADAAYIHINALETMNEALRSEVSALKVTPAPRHPGGKPSHPYWEEAILRVAHQMHLGDFKPQRQADVARALADWIVAAGHEEPGPTALKTRAKLVFDLFRD